MDSEKFKILEKAKKIKKIVSNAKIEDFGLSELENELLIMIVGRSPAQKVPKEDSYE